MISRLLFKKQQGISVKLARITIYLTLKVKKRQCGDYIKNRENYFIIYNQTTHVATRKRNILKSQISRSIAFGIKKS